jgi:hypothetical protein
MSNDGAEGISLCQLASIWSEQLKLERKLVASILLRWARGDYVEPTDHGSNDTPDLFITQLFSGTGGDAPLAMPITAAITTQSGKTFSVQQSPKVSSYYVEAAEDEDFLLETQITSESLDTFCRVFRVSPPHLSSNDGAKSEIKAAGYVARRHNTSQRAEEYCSGATKLRKHHLNGTNETWVAGEIYKLLKKEGKNPPGPKRIAALLRKKCPSQRTKRRAK